MVYKPLTNLLKKNAFMWSSLKQAMCQAPVLARHFTQPRQTQVKKVLGQCFCRPIAYFSKALGVKAQTLAISEKELLALLNAVQRHYLQGCYEN